METDERQYKERACVYSCVENQCLQCGCIRFVLIIICHGFPASKSLLKVILSLAVLKCPCVVIHRSSRV